MRYAGRPLDRPRGPDLESGRSTDRFRALRRPLLAFALLSLFAPAAEAVGLSDSWHVIAIPDAHACYRSTALPQNADAKLLATFHTFRQAGMWEWGHTAICRRGDYR